MTKSKNASAIGAGIVGAVVGAAVGAGAVALSDKKNQKFIKDKFTDLKNKVEELTSEGKDRVETKVKEVKKTIKSKL